MKDELKESCVLKVINVSKSYGYEHEIKAIDGITLEFNSVGMHFITGVSGSGKSTLLNIIGLLDNTYSGSIYLDNNLIDKKDTDTLRAKYYNYVFQDSNLIDDLNLEDNLKIVDLLNNQTKDIDLGDFENLKQKYPKKLSTLEKQLITIKRGLLGNKPIYLCDEPAGHLDYTDTLIVLNELKEISKNNLVIIVVKDLELVNRFADRIIELDKGVVVRDDLINNTSNIPLVKSESVPKLNFKSYIKLVLSAIVLRPVRTTLFFLFSLLFTFGTILFTTIISFDVKGQLEKTINVGEYYGISKKVMSTYTDILGNSNTWERDISRSVFNSDSLYNELKKKFGEKDMAFVIDIVHFTDGLNINSGEALMNKETFISYFKKDKIGDNDIYVLNAKMLGITNLGLKIVGFTNDKGVITPKTSLKRESIDKSLIYISSDYDFYSEDKLKIFGSRGFLEIISLSKLKTYSLDDSLYLSTLNLGDNEIILSSSLSSRFSVNEDKSVNIPTKTYFTNYDLQISAKEVSENYLNVSKYFKGGAEIALILKNTNNILGDTIIVNDNVYTSMIEELKDYSLITIRSTKSNKKQIVKYMVDDNYSVWGESSFDSKPKRIRDFYDELQGSPKKLFTNYTITFMVLNILTLGAFSISMLKSKKKEINLLQSFGFSKFNSFIPGLSSVILPAILSFITAYIITPFVFNQLNKLPEEDEYFLEPIDFITNNLTSVLLNIALFFIVIIIGVLFSSIQFIKYRNKIFSNTNTYSIKTVN